MSQKVTLSQMISAKIANRVKLVNSINVNKMAKIKLSAIIYSCSKFSKFASIQLKIEMKVGSKNFYTSTVLMKTLLTFM